MILNGNKIFMSKPWQNIKSKFMVLHIYAIHMKNKQSKEGFHLDIYADNLDV